MGRGRVRLPQSRVLIIGGGAAGLTAAIAAARLGATVTVLEAGARVGRTILASGNGRCNLTHLSASSPAAYNHPDFVGPVLARYDCAAIRSFFGGMGLLTQVDDEGRVYPSTNAAGTVLDVLRLECQRLGIDVRCEFEVARIVQAPDSGEFEASSMGGDTVLADAVVVTTGGGDSLLGNLGHALVATVPVLGPVKTDADPIRGLSGVRVKCAAAILVDGAAIATECGELLFRDYGVSGIMIFDLSRYLESGCVLSVDFFPDVSRRGLATMVSQRCDALSWRTAGTLFVGMLHDRVARAVLRAASVSADTPVREVPQARLIAPLKDFRLSVLGMADARQAQVTRGGASVADFDPDTLASHRADGLFAAGEVVDIDGRSGGFNLHWAWASGIVAGESAARAAVAHGECHGAGSRGPE